MTTADVLDRAGFEQFKQVIRDPAYVAERTDEELESLVNECRQRINHVRIGGRSTPLLAFAVILWRACERSSDLKIKLDMEECLAMAFRSSLDPSFVQPEWGVVLAGVVIARYEERLPANTREETLGQVRHNLQYLLRCPTAGVAVQRAAAFLLECWNAEFPEGLDPVIQACLDSWPDSPSVASIPSKEFEGITHRLAADFPKFMGSWTDRERQFYRRFMEQDGTWADLKGLSLR